MVDRSVKKKVSHIVVTSSEDEIPLWCHYCSFLTATAVDVDSQSRSGCCSKCEDIWVRPDPDRWKSGWRPSQEQIKIEVSTRSGVLCDLRDI
jgi:hypothetical protein